MLLQKYQIGEWDIPLVKCVSMINVRRLWYYALDIFDEHTSISRIYRNLECQHHLIQERDNGKPVVPCLTPVGFRQWVTLFIQAYPEKEYKRLRKVILNVPINNPDNIKERYPKEIPRKLFPTYGDGRIRKRIEFTISDNVAIENTQPWKLPKFQLLDYDSTSRNDEQRYNLKSRHVRFVLPNSRHGSRQDSNESHRDTEMPKRLSDNAKRHGSIRNLDKRIDVDGELSSLRTTQIDKLR